MFFFCFYFILFYFQSPIYFYVSIFFLFLLLFNFLFFIGWFLGIFYPLFWYPLWLYTCIWCLTQSLDQNRVDVWIKRYTYINCSNSGALIFWWPNARYWWHGLRAHQEACRKYFRWGSYHCWVFCVFLVVFIVNIRKGFTYVSWDLAIHKIHFRFKTILISEINFLFSICNYTCS